MNSCGIKKTMITEYLSGLKLKCLLYHMILRNVKLLISYIHLGNKYCGLAQDCPHFTVWFSAEDAFLQRTSCPHSMTGPYSEKDKTLPHWMKTAEQRRLIATAYVAEFQLL